MANYNLISWPGPGSSYSTEYISDVGGSTLAGTNFWVTRQGGAIQTIVLGGVEYQGTAFWGPNMKMVFSYRVNRGSWTHFLYNGNRSLPNIGPPSPADDAHEYIAFDFDPNGYVHFMYDHHNEAQNYRVSTLPINDPSFAGALGSETTLHAVLDEMTYPFFFRDPGDNNLYFWCGQGGDSGNRDWYMFQYDHTGTPAWAPAPGTSTDGLLLDGLTDAISPYLNLPCFTADWDGAGTGYMYASGIWRDTGDATTNNNVFFFRWNGTTFSKTTGSQTVPIRRANCEVIDSTGNSNGLSTGSCTGVDANGRPHVAYLRGATNRAIVHYHHTGSVWVENTVVTGSGASAFVMPPDIVIRDSDLVAACVIRRESDDHLVAYVSDPNDYTTWTAEDLSGAAIEGDFGGTFHDVYQWRTHQKYEMVYPVSATKPMLLDGLVFHYDLRDVLESQSHSATTLLLTNVNTTTFTSGKIGNAATLAAASAQQLTQPDGTANSQTGALTIAAAVKRTNTGADRGVCGKWLSTGNQRSYALNYQDSTSRYQWFVSGDGSGNTAVLANTFGAGATGAWEGVMAFHDPVADLIGISVNAGTRDTAAHSTNIFDSTALFRIGQANSPTTTNFMNGQIDELALWNVVLSTTLNTFWYNSGDIRPWNEFGMIAPSIWSHGASATVNCTAGDTPSVTVAAWGNLPMTEGLTGTNAASYGVVDNADGTWTITRSGAISAGDETLTLTLTNDAGNDTLALTFSAAASGTPPTITTTASFNRPENSTTAVTMAATGDEPITWSITGGADAALFGVVGATGVVTFDAAPDYEDPQDADLDNVYVLQIRATNAAGTDDLTLNITVTNLGEGEAGSGDDAIQASASAAVFSSLNPPLHLC
jgi:hypothetical protein